MFTGFGIFITSKRLKTLHFARSLLSACTYDFFFAWSPEPPNAHPHPKYFRNISEKLKKVREYFPPKLKRGMHAATIWHCSMMNKHSHIICIDYKKKKQFERGLFPNKAHLKKWHFFVFFYFLIFRVCPSFFSFAFFDIEFRIYVL